ncbi:hypothetical protein L0666_03580 [Octadecabacter sp. CECT 8868]|uniref:hypothetical protein n=1 Tax=Octadecabacter algicola TaxID=2909342 RepID=UPI001F3A7DDE|nr:hypothetical protein [Octadecabacter algicola]MCF2904058.1 hypothetical protein [Octadecabacter algicola]
MEFLGEHGCTLSDESFAGALDVGLAFEVIQLVALSAQATGQAKAQGPFVVFDESVCTIRLPQIESSLSISDFGSRVLYPHISKKVGDVFSQIVADDCTMNEDLFLLALARDSEEEMQRADYVEFLAANIISGDVRFFNNTNSRVFGIADYHFTSGDCASSANADNLQVNHGILLSGFARYVRELGEQSVCGEGATSKGTRLANEIQGYDRANVEPQSFHNIFLFFEYELITEAVGWRNGSWEGPVRPPLCHYPD